MKSPKLVTCSIALTVFGLSVASPSLHAATRDWSATAGTGANAWNTGSNWVGGVAPANNLTDDIARFNQSSYLNQPSTPNLQSINGLVFGNDSTASAAISMITGRNINRLNIGASGIILNEQSGAVILGSGASTEGLQLGASQTWTNNSSGLLTVTTLSNQAASQNFVLTLNGSGSGGFLITGALRNEYDSGNTGTLSLVIDTAATTVTTLNGANAYSGATTVTSGLLNFTRTSAKSSTAITVAAAGSVGLGVGGGGYFNSTAVDQLFSNTLAGVNMNASSGVGIDTTNAAGGNFTYATNQSASRSLTKLGTNSLTLTGSNTYSGPTTVSAGTLLINGSVTSAVSVGANAAIGGIGTINSTLTLATDAEFVLNLSDSLIVTGAVTLDDTFSISSLVNADGSAVNWSLVGVGTYTLIDSGSDFSNIENFGIANAVSVGDGKIAYFENGSLDLVVAVPEPSTWLLLAGGLTWAVVMRRRRA